MDTGPGYGIVGKLFVTNIGGENVLARFAPYVTPVVLPFYNIGLFEAEKMGFAWLSLGIMVLAALGFALIAKILYKCRPTESAGKSMAFPKTEAVLKFLICIPIAIFVGLFFYFALGSGSYIWLYGATIVGGVVISMIVEFIYHIDMRELLRRKVQLILILVASVGILAVFQLDVFGYDSYLPEKDEIAKMSLYNSRWGDIYNYDERKALDESLIEDFDEYYEMAKLGVENVEAHGNVVHGEQDYISVEYLLKSGKRVRRGYFVPTEKLAEAMKEVFANPENVRTIYPIYRLNQKISRIEVQTVTGYEELELTPSQMQELVEIYKEELALYASEKVTGEVLAYLDLSASDGTYYNWLGSYPVTESFAKTVGYMTEHMTLSLYVDVNAEQIKSIELRQDVSEPVESAVEMGEYREVTTADIAFETITITDPKEIKEILPYIHFSLGSNFNINEGRAPIWVDVMKVDGSYFGNAYFKEGEVPQLVLDKLGME